VVAAGAVDADLEPASHVALHRFPVATTRESLRRRCRDLGQDCSHSRSHLNRTGVKEFPARCRTSGIVIAVPAEKRNIVRII
jgi:hypothetical protein